MSVTATEFKMNFGKYLLMAATEDIYITRNGKTIAKLTAPYQNKLDTVNALFGSIPDAMTLEEAQEERLDSI
ncbi:MAG: type II toxin-antitoxin system prevent-host-death family antitoxin [Clostridium sp.]|nr:type II toxin-antitoxin system prevent-host-death family antitoxin [Clostridium sp.]